MALDTSEIGAAHNAVSTAQNVRASLRKRSRKGDPRRQEQIEWALNELKKAMEPIRRELYRTQYEFSTKRQELLKLSSRLQTERRKLWKMKQPSIHGDR